MVNDVAVQEFVNAIKETPTDTNTTYSATVSKVDDEGVVWVRIHGGNKETPTASTSTEVKSGDVVTVQWRNNKLYIGGNYSNPSAGIGTVQPSVDYVSQLIGKDITVNSINAASAYIGELESKNIKAEDISADHAMIKELDVESMSAAVAYIGDLTAENITADDIVADHATVDSLDTNYAQINLANVNNAWIENGLIKDAAITDAQILGVSANKLTAGTIDASNITVTNLNASNITTGSITVDGITIDVTNNEASIDGSYIEDGTITMEGFSQNVKDVIDGAIETFTGTVVPTLNNSPASSWTTTTLKDQHVGDVYYVVNNQSQQNGYCYRFTKSGNTYSWQLIKDSDVTAALSRLDTAEGKIGQIEAFDQTMATFKTETEGEISTLQTKTTSLETSLGDKVDTSTFNELSQTVDGNSATITTLSTITTNNGLTTSTNITNTVNSVSQTATSNSSHISSLTQTLGTNADGTTKAGDIVHQVSDIDQDLDGITTRVSKTEVRLNGQYATCSTGGSTTAKVATITPSLTGYTLEKGAIITVKFTNANTNSAPTLNVNSTGAKAIRTYSGGTLSEAEYKWPAGATMSFVYDDSYWRIQDSTELTRLSTAEGSISTQAGQIALKANAEDVYTKQAANALLEVKANKDTLTSEINASADTVKIQASKVNIQGVITAINNDTSTTINGNKITTGTIDTNQLKANAITADKIAAGAVTADKIAANSISADKLRIGDYTNYITATEKDESSLNTGVNPIISNGWLYKSSGTSANIWLSTIHTNWTKSGEMYRVTGTVKAPAAGSATVIIYGRNEDDSSVGSAYYTKVISADTEVSIDGVIIINDTVANAPKANVGIAFTTTSTWTSSYQQGYCKNMRCERISTGNNNLLVDSQKMSGWELLNASLVTRDTTDEFGVVTLKGTSENWSSCVATRPTIRASILDGTPLWLSFEYKASAALTTSIVLSGTANADGSPTTGTRTKYSPNNLTSLPAASSWTRKIVAMPTSLSALTNGSGDVNSLYIQFYNRTSSGATWQIRKVKLERISATDWTPSPEEQRTYVTRIDDNGIRIHPSSTENNSVVIDGTSMRVYKGGTADANCVAEYGDTARIGKEASEHVGIGNSSITFYKNKTTELSSISYDTQNNYSVLKIPDGSGKYGQYCASGISFANSFNGINKIEYALDSSGNESLRVGNVVEWEMSSGVSSAGLSSGIEMRSDGDGRLGIYDSALTKWLIYHSPNDFAVIPQAGAKTGTNGNPMYVESSGILRRNTSSSARYKKDIEPLKDVDLDPERLYEVDVKQFRYREDYLDKDDQRYDKLIPGFIVEELEKVYPIAVQYENEKAENWDGRYLIPPMLKLIQEQHEQIETLTKRIEALERADK